MNLKKTLTYGQTCDFLLQNSREAEDLYIRRDFTARQLAEHFGIVYSSNFQKACFRTLGDKGKGLGGARTGSGRDKKGEAKRRKKNFDSVTISLSPAAKEALQKIGGTHTDAIERALLFYAKTLTSISEE